MVCSPPQPCSPQVSRAIGLSSCALVATWTPSPKSWLLLEMECCAPPYPSPNSYVEIFTPIVMVSVCRCSLWEVIRGGIVLNQVKAQSSQNNTNWRSVINPGGEEIVTASSWVTSILNLWSSHLHMSRTAFTSPKCWCLLKKKGNLRLRPSLEAIGSL